MIIQTRNFLENLVNAKTFEKFGIRDYILFEKVQYIFKEKMILIFIEKYYIIKILITNEIFNLINFTLTFYETNNYYLISQYFELNKSDKIKEFLYKRNTFNNRIIEIKSNNYILYTIKNENYKEILNNFKMKQIPQSQPDQDLPKEESFYNKKMNIINNKNNKSNQIHFKYDDAQKNNNNDNNIYNNFYQNSMKYNSNNINNNENNDFQNNSFFHNNDISNCQNNLIYNKEYELNQKIYELENSLNKEKMEKNQLILKINNLENILKIKTSNENSLNKVIEELEKTKIELNENLLQLKEELKLKDNEIIKLKEKLNKSSLVFSNENFILNIISFDENINYSILCKKTDTITTIEEKLYDKYPEYRDCNNYFKFKNRKINKFKSLEKNNIKEGNTITLYYSNK